MSSEALPEPSVTPDRESGIELRGAGPASERPSAPPDSVDRSNVQATFMRLGLALARVRNELASTPSPERRQALFTAAATVLDAMEQVQELASRVMTDLMLTLAVEPGIDLAKTSKALGKSVTAMKSGIGKQRATLRTLQPVKPAPAHALKVHLKRA